VSTRTDATDAADAAEAARAEPVRERALAPLAPLRTRGHYSAVHLPDQWFILAESRELKRKPLTRTLQGTPLVLFRDGQGRAATLLDRCPHRNVPLSLGVVADDGCLQCPYHGWRFDGAGACTRVPSLVGPVGDALARRAPSYATVEQQGYVWVYSTADVTPTTAPYRFERMGERGYVTVRQRIDMQGTMYSVLENALDVPHTAFLHKGLFRSDSRGITIEARVRRTRDRVEAEYIGEPRPPGVVARVLSPSGGMVTHFDRFILPSIAQVEYRIGDENHILVDSVMTPVEDFVTDIHAVVSYKMRIPGWIVKPVLEPLALRVFAQDAEMLATQTETVKRFGGEQFVSTEIDVLGKHIRRLLRSAERGEGASEEEASVRLVV
jgi:phenylpropionate dioxygenase-like ring-hydroxylating dioxygenase large terminal subunit